VNYSEARAFLDSSMKFGSKLGLERMSGLMSILGEPAMDTPCIHIAGTNGKGSVTTMTGNILACSGFRTGIYTSPYIHRFSERIRVLGSAEDVRKFSVDESFGEIGESELAACITEVKDAVVLMLEEGYEHPTEFEIVTAAAFLYFEKMSCEYIVLETGLGGRLDSTNVVRSPLVCVITAIGYDHMDRLGNSIREIATEKAGIIKSGSRVIMLDPDDYAGPDDAGVIRDMIEKAVIDKNAIGPFVVSRDRITDLKYSLEGQSFFLQLFGSSVNEGVKDDRDVRIQVSTSLLGSFQPVNCLLAAAAVSGISRPDSIVEGIKASRWPGRFEVIRQDSPLVIIDGAHNLQGASALRDSLEKFCSGMDMVFLCGVMRDKDYKAILSEVLGSNSYNIKGVICTRPDNPRALPSAELASVAQEILDNSSINSYNNLVKPLYFDNVRKALGSAFDLAVSMKSALMIFGSLYMAGEVRQMICERNDKPER